MNIIALLFAVAIGAGLITALILLLRVRAEQAKERWLKGRQTIILKILVPKNNEKTPAAAENLFAALHGIFRPDARFAEYISFEIVASAHAIEFYVQCPTEFRDFIEGQIYAQYPTVEIQEVPDYARVDLADLRLASTDLGLQKEDVFPIKTFDSFEVDPLAGITGVLSKVGEHEQIWIQLLVRPISDEWQHKGIGHVAAIRSGEAPRASFFRLLVKGLIGVLQAPPPEGSSPPPPTSLPASQEAALKAVEEKTTKLGYASKIRLLALAPDISTATMKVNAVTGVFKQFNTINMNGFKAGKISNDPKMLEAYRLRNFMDEGSILNIAELASVYHLPNISVETPNIVWAGAKKGEPPAQLPIEGTIPPDELTLFGMSDFRGVRQRFGIKIKDRRQHMYAIGKSGTGKSTMLENMAIDDIRKGRGVAIVDPHGDFVNNILNFIPASRINDVIYFNPADKEHPVGFNILENVDPDLKNVVASGVVGIFKKIFGETSWGPRLEYILRNVVLALLEYPNATMLSVMRLLVDKSYRTKVLAKVKDPVIREFFINEYEKYDPKFRTEAIAPIQNKVGQFLSASTIRNIVGQPVSTFNIEEAMNQKKIVLLDLSIGKIGEDAASLLGSMMITKIQLAAMRRASMPEADRVDFYLYVDEFQNFATESFATILSEARKYHLNLILTHQYIGQLPEEVAKAIFGNTGTLISFRVGATDAVALVKEFEPVFEANDMVNLDNHHIYAKMNIDGVTRPAFSAITLAPASDSNNNKDKIIRVSREHYSRPRDFVEAKIVEAASTELNPDGGGESKRSNFDEGTASTGQDTAAAGKGASGKGGQVLTIDFEGKSYEGRQDKEGRHWFLETGEAPVVPEHAEKSLETKEVQSESKPEPPKEVPKKIEDETEQKSVAKQPISS
ncbi:MAG: type IV secretion system DNA-binding domain-containing protein, partial [Patescibacteria group bacterium]